MKLAFVSYKYFPFGGLQRDMLKIANACLTLNHEVTIYTLSWDGPKPDCFDIKVMPIKRLTNHGRYQAFYDALQLAFKQDQIDRVVGFNKMPGLDIYFVADSCLKDKLLKERSWLTRQLPRYRHFLAFEKAVFEKKSKTKVLMISPTQEAIYKKTYQIQDERIFMLPPGLDPDRKAPEHAKEIRAEFRQAFSIKDDEKLILCVGSGFKTKGLDRSLKALASLPEPLKSKTHLFAIGSDNPEPFKKLAKILGINSQVTIMSGRDDIPQFLQGGDLLLHPAYYEAAGIVLLEAVIAGLPVLTTDKCGYADHILKANVGQVIESPFNQSSLNASLAEMLMSPLQREWSQNGVQYGQKEDLYSMAEHAASIILKQEGDA